MLVLTWLTLILLNCAEATDPGDPLFLSPLIEKGLFEEARQLSQVPAFIATQSVTSHSGLITVNKTTGASLFFWYFTPWMRSPSKTPLIVWLQGGPGSTSLFGQFVEMGPYAINDSMPEGVQIRDNLPWNQLYNLLFIDQPVGTGYSFAVNDSDYRTNQTGVADHLFIFLKQFLSVFPETATQGLYIAGESYAGKYVPSFAYRVFQEMQSGTSPITLKGIMVGDGLSDPLNMVPKMGDHLYTLGLLNYQQFGQYQNLSAQFQAFINAQQWTDAYRIFNTLILHGVLVPYPSLYQNSSGCYEYYDFYNMCMSEPPAFTNFNDFVERNDTRAKLHVGSLAFHRRSTTVKQYLVEDVPQSVRPYVEEMLNSQMVKVLYYSGMNDLIVPVPATVAFIENMTSWRGLTGFLRQNRTVWTRNDPRDGVLVNGYVQQFANLTYVVVRNAGHAVPYDQPETAFDMIFRFIDNEPFA